MSVPYHGKIIIGPPKDAIGSTEWIGLKIKKDIPKELLSYILMLPDLCEAYRRLQSGKRHARFNPLEFLDLKVQLPDEANYDEYQNIVLEKRKQIIILRNSEKTQREDIDRFIIL